MSEAHLIKLIREGDLEAVSIFSKESKHFHPLLKRKTVADAVARCKNPLVIDFFLNHDVHISGEWVKLKDAAWEQETSTYAALEAVLKNQSYYRHPSLFRTDQFALQAYCELSLESRVTLLSMAIEHNQYDIIMQLFEAGFDRDFSSEAPVSVALSRRLVISDEAASGATDTIIPALSSNPEEIRAKLSAKKTFFIKMFFDGIKPFQRAHPNEPLQQSYLLVFALMSSPLFNQGYLDSLDGSQRLIMSTFLNPLTKTGNNARMIDLYVCDNFTKALDLELLDVAKILYQFPRPNYIEPEVKGGFSIMSTSTRRAASPDGPASSSITMSSLPLESSTSTAAVEPSESGGEARRLSNDPDLERERLSVNIVAHHNAQYPVQSNIMHLAEGPADHPILIYYALAGNINAVTFLLAHAPKLADIQYDGTSVTITGMQEAIVEHQFQRLRQALSSGRSSRDAAAEQQLDRAITDHAAEARTTAARESAKISTTLEYILNVCRLTQIKPAIQPLVRACIMQIAQKTKGVDAREVRIIFADPKSKASTILSTSHIKILEASLKKGKLKPLVNCIIKLLKLDADVIALANEIVEAASLDSSEVLMSATQHLLTSKHAKKDKRVGPLVDALTSALSRCDSSGPAVTHVTPNAGAPDASEGETAKVATVAAANSSVFPQDHASNPSYHALFQQINTPGCSTGDTQAALMNASGAGLFGNRPVQAARIVLEIIAQTKPSSSGKT